MVMMLVQFPLDLLVVHLYHPALRPDEPLQPRPPVPYAAAVRRARALGRDDHRAEVVAVVERAEAGVPDGRGRGRRVACAAGLCDEGGWRGSCEGVRSGKKKERWT